MSRVINPEVTARAVGGELRDVWRCGRSPGKYPGGYPAAFEERALALFSLEPVLHVCAGGVEPVAAAARAHVRGPERVDVFHDEARPRPDGVRGVRPTVLADGRALPYRADSFGVVLLDPPYSARFTRELYAMPGEDYPNPSALLEEAVRVARPGGFVGMLHLVHPPAPTGTRRVARIDVVPGTSKGSRVRRFTVYQKAGEPVRAAAVTGQPDVGRTGSRRGRRRSRAVDPSGWTLAEFGVV